MLDNDNITSTSASEAIEEIPTDEKDYHKFSFMCFTLQSHSIKRTDQHTYSYKQLFTYQDTFSVAKKVTEDILHKTYTEKGAITGI